MIVDKGKINDEEQAYNSFESTEDRTICFKVALYRIQNWSDSEWDLWKFFLRYEDKCVSAMKAHQTIERFRDGELSKSEVKKILR
jgi:hypothetical protein